MIDLWLFFMKFFTTFSTAGLRSRCLTNSGFIFGFFTDTIWLLQVINVGFILVFGYTLLESFYTVEWPCFNINDCAVWLLSWNHVTVAIIILISASTRRRLKTVTCFDDANKMAEKCYKIHRKSMTKVLYYFVTVSGLFLVKTGVSLWYNGGNMVVFVLYSFSYFVPLVMECLVISFCTVVRDMCRRINQMLEELGGKRMNNILLAMNLKQLAETHQQACVLLNTITKCFDKDLFVDLAFNMVWFIVYIYITTVSLWKVKTHAEGVFKFFGFFLEVLFLTIRVCFLSYAVNGIESETRNMLVELRNFQGAKKLDAVCSKIANQFLSQIVDNEMTMQICGCFHVNLSFMRGVIGLATTYLVVFIQYGLGEPSSKTTP